jgi:ribonuclease HI
VFYRRHELMDIYVDGQNTPHHSVICVVLADNGKKIMKTIEKFKDSNDVERMALLEGLKQALIYGGKRNTCLIMSDSVIAVRDFHIMKKNESIRKEIKESGKKIVVCWMPRNTNKAGKHLENRLETLKISTSNSIGVKRR